MTRTLLLLLAVLTIALHACSAAPRRSVLPISDPDQLASAERVALDVENRLGSIRIIADPACKGVEVAAVPVGDFGQPTKPAWAAVEIQKTDLHPVVRVLSIPDPAVGSATPRPTDLVIHVKRLAGLRVRNAGGAVVVHGASGAVDVQNGDDVRPGGDVSVIFADPIDSPVMLRSSLGHVLLAAPRRSSGLLEFRAGRQTSVHTLREPVTGVHADRQAWTGVLRSGQFNVVAVADVGDVTFHIR